MGKKRIIKKSGDSDSSAGGSSGSSKSRKTKRRLTNGIVHVNSTYNNTIVNITDDKGETIFTASAGSLGFKGAKKGTPFAATKVSEQLAEKAKNIGIMEVGIFVKGVGAGRESAIRALASNGLIINFIKDITPLPFNGPRAPKPRRV
jgi:small subunit ribosomal protein S11